MSSREEALRRQVRRLRKELRERSRQIDEYGQHLDVLYDRMGTLEYSVKAIAKGEREEAQTWLGK